MRVSRGRRRSIEHAQERQMYEANGNSWLSGGLALAASIVACGGRMPSVERRVLSIDIEGETPRIEWWPQAQRQILGSQSS